MNTQTASVALVTRFDISAHVAEVATHLGFLSSRKPAAADLIHRIKGGWIKSGVPVSPGTNHTGLIFRVDEITKNLQALSGVDPIMRPYVARALHALDGLSVVLAKSDEDYAREQTPADRNQIILDQIRQLLA